MADVVSLLAGLRMASMTISELFSRGWDEAWAPPYLGPFLKSHGVDLCAPECPRTLERGTPVYVRAEADPIAVQRRMAESHVHILFVLDDDDAVVGIVDIRDLVMRAEMMRWLADQGVSPMADTI